MPAEFHIQTSGVVETFECLKHRLEFDRPFAESEVIVNPSSHIFNVDCENSIVPIFEIARDGKRLKTMNVANIDGKSEARPVDQRQ